MISALIPARPGGRSLPLPFPPEPAIRSYLHHAFTTGVLGAWSRLPVAYRDYVNLEFRSGDPFSDEDRFLDFTPYVDLRSVATRAGLIVVDRAAAFFAGQSASHIAHHIRAALEAKAYVSVYLDGFFVPWAASFGRRHRGFQHVLLGFSEGVFTGINYRDDHTLGPCTVTAELLIRALASQTQYGAPHQNANLVREVRIADAVPEMTSLDDLGLRLRQFWAGEPSAEESRQDGYLYGAHCYEAVSDEIETAIRHGSPIDARKTRLLWERAENLGKAFEYCIGRPYAEGPAAVNWREMTDLFHAAHLDSYKHNVRGRHAATDSANRIVSLIDRAAELEKRAADEICQQLI